MRCVTSVCATAMLLVLTADVVRAEPTPLDARQLDLVTAGGAEPTADLGSAILAGIAAALLNPNFVISRTVSGISRNPEIRGTLQTAGFIARGYLEAIPIRAAVLKFGLNHN